MTLEMIRNTYGSVEKYVVNDCNVSPAYVEQLRRNLTEDVLVRAKEASRLEVRTAHF